MHHSVSPYTGWTPRKLAWPGRVARLVSGLVSTLIDGRRVRPHGLMASWPDITRWGIHILSLRGVCDWCLEWNVVRTCTTVGVAPRRFIFIL